MSTKNQKAAAKKWKKIKGEPAKEPVPSQYHTVTPALTQANAAEAIEFYKAAFGAVELSRAPDPSGKLMHAELKIGDSIIMLSDEYPEMGGKSPKTLGGSPVALHYYTEDVDAAFAKATGAKATTIMPVADMFWGDRYGAVLDSSGFMWGIATHKEDVSPEEMAERMKKLPPTT
ncbi:MAG: VOC family protein [Myxococcales bacterium]|nr:VOC family protein [Myxococcales bacterium]